MSKLKRSDLAKFYKRIPEEVLKDLAESCFDDSTTYVRGDAYTTIFNEGKRAVLKRIQFYRTADPSKLEEA